MAADDLTQVTRLDGRIVIGPTNLAAAFPYGGTTLGIIGAAYAEPRVKVIPWDRGAERNQLVDSLYVGETLRLSAVLRQVDTDAVTHSFYNTAAGISTGKQYAYSPGAFCAGKLLSAKRAALLVVPYDTTAQRCLLLYAALPQLDVMAKLNYALDTEHTLACVWDAMERPTGNGWAWAYAYFADLAL